MTNTHGWYFGYISISAATLTRHSEPDRATIPRNPKNDISANDRKSENCPSTSRHSSRQRSSVSPEYQYSHAQSWSSVSPFSPVASGPKSPESFPADARQQNPPAYTTVQMHWVPQSSFPIGHSLENQESTHASTLPYPRAHAHRVAIHDHRYGCIPRKLAYRRNITVLLDCANHADL